MRKFADNLSQTFFCLYFLGLKISVLRPTWFLPRLLALVKPYCVWSVKPTHNEFVSGAGGTPTSQSPPPGAENSPFAIGIELSDADSCYRMKLTCLFTEKQRQG